MSFKSVIENIWAVDEKFVLSVIAKVKAAAPVIEHEINLGLTWVGAHAGDIARAVQTLESVVIGSGMKITPQVQAAIDAANKSVSAINAYAAAQKAGQSTMQSLEAGYIAVKGSESLAAQAAISVVAQAVDAGKSTAAAVQ